MVCCACVNAGERLALCSLMATRSPASTRPRDSLGISIFGSVLSIQCTKGSGRAYEPDLNSRWWSMEVTRCFHRITRMGNKEGRSNSVRSLGLSVRPTKLERISNNASLPFVVRQFPVFKDDTLRTEFRTEYRIEKI